MCDANDAVENKEKQNENDNKINWLFSPEINLF